VTITRRQFCTALGAIGLTSTGARKAAAAADSADSLRVIAYNIYGGHGWPSDRTGAKAAVKKGRIARLLADELARHRPDIVNFSESPGESIVQEIAQGLGMNVVRFPSGGHWPGSLLSRYEIVESQNVPLGAERPTDLFTRHWGRGVIQLPAGQKLIVHSAHLYPTADPATRLREIPAMLAAMKDDLKSGQSMLLMGDLNHRPHTDEYKLWMSAGWTDSFAKVGKGKGPTIKADHPNRRIDYVMAAGPIASRIVESRPLFEGASRLDANDPESFALSDHLPQLAVFSLK
jgi:endonuclease/exonuclease/phosphatase family metal-dependent hydrolase